MPTSTYAASTAAIQRETELEWLRTLSPGSRPDTFFGRELSDTDRGKIRRHIQWLVSYYRGDTAAIAFSLATSFAPLRCDEDTWIDNLYDALYWASHGRRLMLPSVPSEDNFDPWLWLDDTPQGYVAHNTADAQATWLQHTTKPLEAVRKRA
jgi:hypothetical protein